ncbi:hypothetical protein HPB50_011771 [Hyalomma asiaticum]|uniref:Uncharacterized protein n=1 Tax=Hyalomma asiaticum TaxID=266040 RepID=A0ACB7TGQ4_HYAAI|nr:hypothetical protein HPB50_011771 [Hyalomma asiaticum]
MSHRPCRRTSVQRRHRLMLHGVQRRAQYRKRLSMELWRRWKRSCLLQLRSAHYRSDKVSSQFRVGDVVTAHEESAFWTFRKPGRATSLHTLYEADSSERVCSVRLASGHVVNRPVQQLYV